MEPTIKTLAVKVNPLEGVFTFNGATFAAKDNGEQTGYCELFALDSSAHRMIERPGMAQALEYLTPDEIAEAHRIAADELRRGGTDATHEGNVRVVVEACVMTKYHHKMVMALCKVAAEVLGIGAPPDRRWKMPTDGSGERIAFRCGYAVIVDGVFPVNGPFPDDDVREIVHAFADCMRSSDRSMSRYHDTAKRVEARRRKRRQAERDAALDMVQVTVRVPAADAHRIKTLAADLRREVGQRAESA